MKKTKLNTPKKWIINRHDISPEQVDKLKINNIKNFNKDGSDLLLTFQRYVDKVSENNVNITTNMFFVFLSQYFNKNFNIDVGGSIKNLKFSSLIIQQSRTGKNYSSDIIVRLCELSKKNLDNEVKIIKVTSFTELGIIGRPNENNINSNNKLIEKGYTEDSYKELYNEYEIKKKNNVKITKSESKLLNSIKFKDEWNKGLMEQTDILLFEEAKTLFTGFNKESISQYLQEIMDNKGEIVYKVGSSKIHKRKTNCSLLLTTVPFDSKDITKIIDNGFFQRFLITYKNFTQEQIINFKDNINKKLYKYSISQEKKEFLYDYKWRDEILNEIIEGLSEIKNKTLKGDLNKKITLNISLEALKLINSFTNKQIILAKKNLYGKTFSLIESFDNVVRESYYKLSALNKITRCFSKSKSNDFIIDDINEPINKIDVYAVESIINKHIVSMIDMISDLYSNEDKKLGMLAKQIGIEFKPKKVVLEIMSRYTHHSIKQMENELNKLVKYNFVEHKYNEIIGDYSYKCLDGVINTFMSDKELIDYKKNESKPLKLIKKEVVTKYFVLFIRYFVNKYNKPIDIYKFQDFMKIFPQFKNVFYSNLLNKLIRNDIIIKKNLTEIYLTSDSNVIKSNDKSKIINEKLENIYNINLEYKKYKKDLQKNTLNKNINDEKLNEFKKNNFKKQTGLIKDLFELKNS